MDEEQLNNLTSLEISKKIAEIRKLVTLNPGDKYYNEDLCQVVTFKEGPYINFSQYYPTYGEENLKLRDEFNVYIDYFMGMVSIYEKGQDPNELMAPPLAEVYYTSKEGIPKAVCLAIIEANS